MDNDRVLHEHEERIKILEKKIEQLEERIKTHKHGVWRA